MNPVPPEREPVDRPACQRKVGSKASHTNLAGFACGPVAILLLLFFPGAQHPEPARPPVKPLTDQVSNNPLYPEFQRIGIEHQIDLSFTRNVISLTPYDSRLYEDGLSFPIFCNPKKSFDVILVGDSTLSWGVMPGVIEQMTGLRVGMFAFRSMFLNRRSLAIAERVIRHYLKENGLSIYGFTVWTQMQPPGTFRRGELLKLESMKDEEFEAFTARRRLECGRSHSAGTMDTEQTQAAPPGPRFSLNQFQFLKWDNETFTLVGPTRVFSIPSRTPANEHMLFSPNHAMNARSLIGIPGRKAFLITIYAHDFPYVVQRSIYGKLYSRDLELIDLGLLHPGKRGLPMDEEDHPANTGGLEKTILIAKWLRENFAKSQRDK